MRLEMRHLRVLDTVARSGGVTRAATLLGVTQPALTRQLARIEGVLGAEVFARGPRGVTATPFGEFVLARTRAALAEVDDILAYRQGAAPSAVRLGGFDTPVLLGVADGLERLLPGGRLSVHAEYDTRLLLDMVADQRLDAALVADYPGYELRPNPAVEQRVAAIEPIFVAVPAGHRLAGREEIDLAELAGENWVLPPSDGTGWPEHLLEVCAEHGFTPRSAYRMTGAEMRREVISAGWAIAPCQALFDGGADVVVRPLSRAPLRMRYIMAWHPDGPLGGHSEELVELVRRVYTTATPAPPDHRSRP